MSKSQAGRSASGAADREKIDTIRGILPDVDVSVIVAVLEACGGNVDVAVHQLMQSYDPAPTPMDTTPVVSDNVKSARGIEQFIIPRVAPAPAPSVAPPAAAPVEPTPMVVDSTPAKAPEPVALPPAPVSLQSARKTDSMFARELQAALNEEAEITTSTGPSTTAQNVTPAAATAAKPADAPARENPLAGCPRIYHETQRSLMCGLHAINCLLQGPVFTSMELKALGEQADAEERARMAEGGLDSTAYLEYVAEGSNNYNRRGFFSVEVVKRALAKWSLELVPLASPGAHYARARPHEQQAFICHTDEHWYTVRKLHKRWFSLDSLLKVPRYLTDNYLELFLKTAEAAGFTVFIVRGELPDGIKPESVETKLRHNWKEPTDKEEERPKKRTKDDENDSKDKDYRDYGSIRDNNTRRSTRIAVNETKLVCDLGDMCTDTSRHHRTTYTHGRGLHADSQSASEGEGPTNKKRRPNPSASKGSGYPCAASFGSEACTKLATGTSLYCEEHEKAQRSTDPTPRAPAPAAAPLRPAPAPAPTPALTGPSVAAPPSSSQTVAPRVPYPTHGAPPAPYPTHSGAAKKPPTGAPAPPRTVTNSTPTGLPASTPLSRTDSEMARALQAQFDAEN